jgi:hypothetical protein
MSAYGNIAVTGSPVDLLQPTSWDLPAPPPGKLERTAPFRRLALHHLRPDGARTLPGLLEYTHRIFADEIEAGRTYPQEADATVTTAAAAAAGGDLGSQDAAAVLLQGVDHHAEAGAHDFAYTRAAYEAYFWAADVFVAIGVDDAADVVGGGGDLDVEASRRGRKWEDVLVGFYYVKPNYPGRSSHVSAFFLHIDMHHYMLC